MLNNENKRKKLVEAQPTFLKISLQTIDKSKFNWSRGTNLDVEEYFTESINYFLKLKKKTRK